jgi:hypothetical protein
MKLRCIKQSNRQKDTGNLTIGKIYELDEIGLDQLNRDAYVGSYSSLYIKDDDNIYRYYDKECFIARKRRKTKTIGNMKVICVSNIIVINNYKRTEPLLIIGKEYTLSGLVMQTDIDNWESFSNWVEEEQRWIPPGYFVKAEDYKQKWRNNQLEKLGI